MIRLLFIISFLSIGAMTCTVRLYPFCLKLFFRRWFFFLQKGKKNHAPLFQCYCIKIDVSLFFQKLFFQVNKFSLLFFVLFFLMESLCVCVQEKNTTSLFVSLTQFIACVDITITGLFGNGRLLEECAVYLVRLVEKRSVTILGWFVCVHPRFHLIHPLRKWEIQMGFILIDAAFPPGKQWRSQELGKEHQWGQNDEESRNDAQDEISDHLGCGFLWHDVEPYPFQTDPRTKHRCQKLSLFC